MRRRSFVASLGASAAAVAAPRWTPGTAQSAIPRWRGFNLLDLFQALTRDGRRPAPASEDEFRWIRDWGFNFVRIPMDYWLWIDTDWPKTKKLGSGDMYKIKVSAFDEIDRIVELGRRYGLHVSLNFHRAPGYCVNNAEREPFVLWSDKPAEDAFVHHWAIFAQRYKGVSDYDLSFNLLNEAPRPREGYMTRADYVRVMSRATEEIRAISPKRLVIIDGLETGNSVVHEMIPTGVAQSVHAYWPGQISHYRASWVDRESKFPLPAWPILAEDGTVKAGRKQLEDRYAPWAELAKQGIGVHCGEAGCYSRTPHAVFLAWFEDVLQILAGYNIGWALWNLGGGFGVLNSGRDDVAYEDWYGRKLDRKLLALMQKY
ncbi:MAG: cellulase family glycosylhydrolase [Acidobacteria bacterium]|nr:cellulase family glycosylhydrolase [Acidobacteriota bacterium]